MLIAMLKGQYFKCADGRMRYHYLPIPVDQESAKSVFTDSSLTGTSGPGDHPVDHYKVSGVRFSLWEGWEEQYPPYPSEFVSYHGEKLKDFVPRIDGFSVRGTKDRRYSDSYLNLTITGNGVIRDGKVDFPCKWTYTDYTKGTTTTGVHEPFVDAVMVGGISMYTKYLLDLEPRPWTLQEALALDDDPGIPHGAVSELFRETVGSLTSDSNGIANCVEFIDLLRDLKSLRLKSVVSDIKNMSALEGLSKAWMSYRYSFSTTKSDIEDAERMIKQALDINQLSHFVRHGSMKLPGGKLTCTLEMSTGTRDKLDELTRWLHETGLYLSAYAAWDMVPLSFVVDWFLPIGDFLEDLQDNWVTNPGMFTFHRIVYSYKRTVSVGEPGSRATLTKYNRWLLDTPPAFESYSEDPSTKTVIKRFIDGACLFVK